MNFRWFFDSLLHEFLDNFRIKFSVGNLFQDRFSLEVARKTPGKTPAQKSRKKTLGDPTRGNLVLALTPAKPLGDPSRSNHNLKARRSRASVLNNIK